MEFILAFDTLIILPYSAVLDHTRTIFQQEWISTAGALIFIIGDTPSNDAFIMVFDEGVETGRTSSFLVYAPPFPLQAFMSIAKVVAINATNAHFIIVPYF